MKLEAAGAPRRSAGRLSRRFAPAALCALTFATGCSRGAERAPSSSAATSSSDAGPREPTPAAAEPAAPAAAAPGGERDAARTPASSAAPALDAPAFEDGDAAQAKKKSSPTEPDLSRLDATKSSFDEALEPERLSCDGARPLRDAICEIAERLCDLSAKSPTSTNSHEDCSSAKTSCAQAQRKYEDRCGK